MTTNDLLALPSNGYPFVSGRTLEQIFGWSSSTTKRMRRDGRLVKNLHWFELPKSGRIRFNLRLIEDLIANQGDELAIQRGITSYLERLPSNQRRARRSSS